VLNSADCDGFCDNSDRNNSVDCNDVCETTDGSSSPDCEGRCNVVDEAASSDCDTICQPGEQLFSADCDDVCDLTDVGGSPDCEGACETVDPAGSADCDGACDPGDPLVGSDCDGLCQVGDRLGSVDCDDACTASDTPGSVDCEGSCDLADDLSSSDCDGACDVGDVLNSVDCDDDCTLSDAAGSADCEGRCDPVDDATGSDCDTFCDVGDAAAGVDCDADCDVGDAAGSPDCNGVCEPLDATPSVDCDLPCDIGDLLSGDDCDGFCNVDDELGSVDCDGACGPGDDLPSADCDSVCEPGDLAASVDCEGACEVTDIGGSPDCEGGCDFGDDLPSADCERLCDPADDPLGPDCATVPCIGVGDDDGDGVCDDVDVCPGFIDGDDGDGDGTPDGCDPCGNGVLDAGEACDDGNAIPYDGCSASCVIDVDTDGDGVVDQLETDVLGTDPTTADDLSCDGGGDPRLTLTLDFADTVIEGDRSNTQFGRYVDGVGDFDGDGFDDLVVGAPNDRTLGGAAGAVYLFFGPVDPGSLDTDDADVTLYGAQGLRAGTDMAGLGDIDGDGRDDLAIGSRPASGSSETQGVVWLVYGTAAPAPVIDLAVDADATIRGGTLADRFGTEVSAAGDLDADGLPDFVIGAPFVDGAEIDSGAAYLYTSAPSGSLRDVDADAVFAGPLESTRAGSAFAPIGDFDGDGFDDLAIGGPRDPAAGNQSGRVFIVNGGPGIASAALDSVDVSFVGTTYDRAGSALAPAGDVNADGYDDLWVTAPQWAAGRRGAAFLVLGGDLTGAFLLNDIFQARLSGRRSGDYLGQTIAGDLDIDGDGELDVVIGAQYASDAVDESGASYALLGPFTDAVPVDDVGARYGTQRRSRAGTVAALGDTNGDGFDDYAIGAYRQSSTNFRGAGYAGVFLGGATGDASLVWYADADGDGYGDPNVAVTACNAPVGFVDDPRDCDDSDAAIQPFAIEDDCNLVVDLNCDGVTGSTDGDGDGLSSCFGDCDDTNATTRPGGAELCGDGLDNDCDGLIDDPSAADAPSWYPDGDGDGFGLTVFEIVSCTEPPAGLSPFVLVDADCNDLDPAINPSGIEFCDLVDNDCNGIDDDDTAADAERFFADADGDGFGDRLQVLRACSQPAGATTDARDCDDTDAAVRPGALEQCNGLDDDCDGTFYRGGPVDLGDAELRLRGESIGDGLGRVAFVPDMNGDGIDEVLVGAPDSDGLVSDGGAVYLRYGTAYGGDEDLGEVLAAGFRNYDARILGDRGAGRLGFAMDGGDVNGDGIGDLVIGAPGQARPNLGQGAVFVFFGPVSGELLSESADLVITGANAAASLGETVAVQDLDGDGFDDLLLGSPLEDGPGSRRGALHIVYGSAAPVAARADILADATLFGTDSGSAMGASVAAADIDDDGDIDLLVGAPDQGALDNGALFVVYGTGARFSGNLAPSALLSGAGTLDRVGASVAAVGDTDGDGIDDLLIGSSDNRAWLIEGSTIRLTSSEVGLAASTTFTGEFAVRLGTVVAAAGDLNADGLADFLISAHRDSTAFDDAGQTLLVYGAADLPADVVPEDVESFGRLDGGAFPTFSFSNLGGIEGALLQGSAPDDRAGRYLAGGHDVTGDGLPDLLLGAPNAQSDRGSVFVLAGGPYGLDVGPNGADGWLAALAVDGDDAEWDPAFTTASGATTWATTWDADNLYLGSRAAGIPTGSSNHRMIVYLGDGDGTGGTLGLDLSGQQATLPFAADRAILWRADGTQALYRWNGASFDAELNYFGTAGSALSVDTGNSVLELSLPWTELGDPTELQLVGWWVFAGGGAASNDPVPTNAFASGTFDPNATEYLPFARNLTLQPSGYGSLPSGGGAPDVTADMTTYYADADLDGQGDETDPGFLSCPMHAPIDFTGSPTLAAVTSLSLVTDCDDADPAIFEGAPETNADGVDSNCDGLDNVPSSFTAMAPTSPRRTLVHDAHAPTTVDFDTATSDLDGDGLVDTRDAWRRRVSQWTQDGDFTLTDDTVWRYELRTGPGVFEPLTAGSEAWEGALGARIDAATVAPSSAPHAVTTLTWVSPVSGTVTVEGLAELDGLGGDGVLVRVAVDGGTLMQAALVDNETAPYAFAVDVTVGSRITFQVAPEGTRQHDAVRFDPVITLGR
jgi:hypothetical protein